MQQPQSAPYPISDFLQWEGMSQLELTPKFQRRDVWPPKAKSYLIDTIIRRMPIPPIFIRLRLNHSSKRMVREVIDGQQRLRTVLGFVGGAFPLSAAHSADYPDAYWNDLPEAVQGEFLSYKFTVSTFENLSDADVLRIFARLNTYTEPLKGVELLNSEFFGAFKQVVFDIALDHNTFWTRSKIISDKYVARMRDAEFTSELIICMLNGIRQTKLHDIREYFKIYDDHFPEAKRIQKQFAEVIDLIGNALGDEIAKSPFRRMPLFFSLFLALFDAMFGLPNSPVPTRGNLGGPARAAERIRRISADLKAAEAGYARRLLQESARATADATRRRERHKILYAELTN